MCTLSSIRMLVMVLSWFKLIFTIYIFYTGCYFAGSTDLQQAFGMQFQGYGLSLIFLALLSGTIILPHKYGVNRHNRFIMAATFVFDTIVFANLISLGMTVFSYTTPAFSKALQTDCLRNTPEIYSLEECQSFYNSGRTAGFRLVWASYFSGMGDKTKFQVLATITENGLCCGFFPPDNCMANSAKFPSNRLTKGVSPELLKARVTCGEFEGYYPQQRNCVDYIDFAADPKIVGGCFYDLGVGFCLKVAQSPALKGCASAMEDYVVGLIAPHAVMLMLCSLFNAVFMLFACCMWWKRKDTDIFPEFVTEHKSSVQYHNVPSQFVVAPKKDLLRREGFLPQLTETETAPGREQGDPESGGRGEERKEAESGAEATGPDLDKGYFGEDGRFHKHRRNRHHGKGNKYTPGTLTEEAADIDDEAGTAEDAIQQALERVQAFK